MFKKEFPRFSFGKTSSNWLHSKLANISTRYSHKLIPSDLEEVADFVGIPFVTQVMLKHCDPELRDQLFKNAPMRHNAAGDVLITLVALVELLRYKGLDFASLGNWTILAYDL